MAEVCEISRDKNNEIQEVYALNKKPSILYHDILTSLNDESPEGKEKALKIWARAYTDGFKKTFGNWELVAEAKTHVNELTGVNRSTFESNPQHFLFEVAVQSLTNLGDEKVVRTYGSNIVRIAEELYPDAKIGQIYKPVISKPLDENGEPLAINVMNSTEKAQFAVKNKEIPDNNKEEANKVYGKIDTINYFETQSKNVKLDESGDISYYTNGTVDNNGQLRKFMRLTDYVRNQFAPEERSKSWSNDPDTWLNKATERVFAKANAELTDKIPYGQATELQSFDEVKSEIKKSYEDSRIRGKILHKMIEGFLKFNDIKHFQEDIDTLRQQSNISEYDLLWFDPNRIKSIMLNLGINSADYNNTDVAFRDNIASELMMVNESLGIGTSNDGLIEHSDGTVSFMDYKTGSKFLADENTQTKMLYSNGLVSPIYDSKLNRAKLELVTRMIMAKMNKPDLRVRDLKIAYISRYYGDQIRNIDTQAHLDYIANNLKVTIKELEKASKDNLVLKEQLTQKRLEYKAMHDAKVFDFHNYQGESNIFDKFQDDETLATLTDPKQKMDWLKNKVANKTRESLIKEHEVTRSTLKNIKTSVIAVLNSVKSTDQSNVETTDKNDISLFASYTLGLRDQKNAFLQSFSQLYETAVDKLFNRTNTLLGEQSDFRKADRALYKEYFQRSGRSQAIGAKVFSYSKGNEIVPINKQGVFDFMYTWKNIGGEPVRIGATYTEQDINAGKITQAQWNYYKESKKVLKEVYEGVRTKVAYTTDRGRNITYGEEYQKNDGFGFKEFEESFLPTIPFQRAEEIAEKNIETGNLNPLKLLGEYFNNYQNRYNLAIQNEDRFNIGVPLKYMSNNFLENDDHSYNVTNAVDIFSRHMIQKLELDDVYDIGESTIAVMADVKDPNNVNRKGKLRLKNAIFALQTHLDQHILGKKRLTTKYTKNEAANKRIDLVIDNIGSFISKNAFWFAPLTSTFNGLFGVFTNGKEGLIGSLSGRLFGDNNAVTMSHMLEASKISGVHQATNLTKQSNIKRQFNEDWEGSYYKDKVNFMTKIFRLNNKDYNYTDASLMLGVHNRIFTGDSAYIAQGLGEDMTNETFVIASMLARKVEVKSVDNLGKEVTNYLKKDGTYTTDSKADNLENMWDIYKYNLNSKEYEYSGPTRFIDKDGQEVKGMTTLETLRIKTYLERLYGAYSPEQKTALERFALGRMLMKFRKFQIMNIKENFTLNSHMKYVGEYKQMFNADMTPKLKDGQPMYDWQSEVMRSRLLVVSSLVGGWLNMKSGKSWEDMSLEEKKQVIRFGQQMVFYGITVALGIGALVPPEDKNKMYVGRLTRLADDLAIISPTTLLKGTTTLDSYPEQLVKLSDAFAKFMNSILTDDIVSTGKYEGDYKGWNTLEDFIPIYHPINQTIKLSQGQ